ncbi:recombinase family protein [Bacillus coreaensis]
MEKVSVCAYCRVSTDSKDQENSFENQKSYFEREIKKNEKYSLYKIYADKGITGTSLSKREQFNQMLYDAGLNIIDVEGEPTFRIDHDRKPMFKRILVKNSSRFARNMEVISIIRKLKENGVYIDFFDINISTDKEDYEFVLNLFLNFDQQDSIDKSKKVKFGIFESAKKGNIFTNKRIYGYNYNLVTKELEIIEDEAKVISKIFNLYVNHKYGFRKIVDYLNENNYRTREGKPFIKSTISRILENEKYCGTLIRNKYDTGVVFHKKKTPKKRPENEWVIHEERVPAIIEKDIFQKAQEIRKSKARKQRGVYHGKSEFAGLIKCKQCGASYTRNVDKGRVFYNCSTKKTRGIKACDNVNLSEEYIHTALYGLAHGGLYEVFNNNKDIQIEQLTEIQERMKQSIDKDTFEDAEIKKDELNTLEEKKSKIIDLYLEDTFDMSVLHEKNEQIEEEIKRIKQEITELSKGQNEILEDIEELNKIISMIKTEGIKKVFTREEIINNIKTITIERDSENRKQPYANFELKVFDVINRYVGNYSEQIRGKRIDYTNLNVSDYIG